jgi:hypothetical protein
MRKPIKSTRAAVALAVGLGLAGSATAVYAAGQEADGVHLQSEWTNGGHAWLELEDRNAEPAICFIWDNPAPQNGDAIHSRILTRTGQEVVDLGTADQWIEGSGEGCEIPKDEGYRAVFANPGNFVVEFQVIENQGTPSTASPIRSQPLQRASG